jgi:hypothetical protein
MYDCIMSTVADLADQILVSPEALVDAIADHERHAAVLALAVAHVRNTGDWAADGSVSMRAWMRNACSMSDRDAAAWVRRARLLDGYGAVADAAVDRTLSSSQLSELERLNKPKYEALLREHQEMLVGVLGTLDAEGTQQMCEEWRRKADAILDEKEPPLEPVNEMTLTHADDGTLHTRGVHSDAAANEIEKAINTARTHEGDDDTRTVQERNADALHDICSFFNKNHDGNGTPRHMANVSLSLNADSLDGEPVAVNEDDQRVVSSACADAKLCDCILHTVLREPNGAPSAFGRATYTVPRKLFREVAARDGGCRFPGCNRKVRHTEAHHIHYWRHGGFTDYMNLVLLCSRHHHYVHEQRLQLKLLPNAELVVTWLDGRERTSLPRGAPPRGRPFEPPTP